MTTNSPENGPAAVGQDQAEADGSDDDERTVRQLLRGAQNPIGDVERGAAGLPHRHLDGSWPAPEIPASEVSEVSEAPAPEESGELPEPGKPGESEESGSGDGRSS